MSLEFLQPFAGTHAIQQANFTLNWTPMPLGQADRYAEACAEELGAAMRTLGLQEVVPLTMMQFQFGPMGPGPMALSPSTGVGYEGKLPSVSGGPSFHVHAALQDGLTIQVQQYTRWNPVLARVLDIARALVPVSAKVVPLVRIGLQVVDSFNWNAPVSELDISAIFDRGSPWLAPHVFECRTFWHCNHGYFEASPLAGCGRQLNNINLSVSGAPERPLVQAALVHVVDLEGDWRLREAGHIDRVAKVFEHLHAYNKAVVGKLLTAEVAGRVALWGSAGQVRTPS